LKIQNNGYIPDLTVGFIQNKSQIAQKKISACQFGKSPGECITIAVQTLTQWVVGNGHLGLYIASVDEKSSESSRRDLNQ
jgi:hypothetical protein